MEYQVIILSDKFLLGQTPFSWHNFLCAFAKNNAKIASINCQKFSTNLSLEGGDLLVLADNEKLDSLLLENLQKLGNDKEIVDDLAVIFTSGDRKIIFLPIDVSTDNLLEKVLKKQKNGQKTCKFQLFGKTIAQVTELVKGVEGVEFNILGDNLLSCVYASYEGEDNVIDDKQVQIASLLRENMFSENDLDLAGSVTQLLRLKNQKIAICESVTSGKILSMLGTNENFAQVLKSGTVTAESGQADSEKIYTQALELLKSSGGDIVLAIDGKFDEKGLNCLIAVGNKNSINVYKNRFNGTRENVIVMASNCALYHLVKKLRQNDFAF